MTTLTLSGRSVRSNAPLREQVASLSSGNYYATPSEYYGKVESTLSKEGLSLDWGRCPLTKGDGNNGYMMVPLVGDGDIDTHLWVSWHRMEFSGRWEMVGYLS